MLCIIQDIPKKFQSNFIFLLDLVGKLNVEENIEQPESDASDLIFIYEPINGAWRGITTQFEKRISFRIL